MNIFSKIVEFFYSTFPTIEKWIKECNGYYAIYFDKKRGRWLFESLEFKDVPVTIIKYIKHEDKKYTVTKTHPYKNYKIEECTDGSFICIKTIIREFPYICDTIHTVKTDSLETMKELLNGK